MLSLVLMSLLRGWRALPVVVCLFGWSAGRAQSPEVAGTMPEDYLPALKPILATALKQAPQSIMKELELAQAKARIYEFDAARLPNASGNLNFASNATATSSKASTRTRDNGVFYNFGVSQALFHWGALMNESDKGRINLLMAQKSYDEGYRLLAVALRRSYLELIVKKAALAQARFARGLLANELALAEEKFKDGLLSEGDVAGRKLNFQDVDLQTARIELELSGLRRVFSRVAGIAELSEAAIPGEIPRPAFSPALSSALLAGLVREGARGTFLAQVSELRIREADLNYRIARVRLLPKFNAGASLSLENTTNASANSVSQQGVSRQTLSVGANWAIFDGFYTRGAKLELLATKRYRERELQNATESALDAAQNLSEQVALDVRAMDSADLRRTLAAAQVEKSREELAFGNLAKNAVENAIAVLNANDTSNASARAAFLSRWSEFVSLTGTDPVFSNLPVRHDREKR